MSKVCPNRLWIGGLCAVAILSQAGQATAQGQGGVKMEDILQAAQRRQGRVQSLHFAWTEQVTDGKDSRTPPPSPLHPGRGMIPPRDVTYDEQEELWIDGEKMRYAESHHEWVGEKQAMVSFPQVAAFDGKLLKTLFERGGPGKEHPCGTIEAKERHFDVGSVFLLPLLMTFRASHPHMRPLDIGHGALTGKRVPIEGRVCYEALFRHSDIAEMEYVWVDPSRDFVISRYVVTHDGKLTCQVNIRYAEDAQAGWIPADWDIATQFPDGRFRMSARAKVVQYEINPSIPADQFDIDFPRGARMTNFVTGEKYIIKADGTIRPIVRGELPLAYEQLIASEPGELLGEKPSFFGRWWVWLLAALGFGSLGLAYCWRRLQARQVPAPRAE